MAGGYTSLPTSHLLGSVPAAVDADHKASEFEEANLQIFPPSNGQSRTWGYQPPNDVDDLFAQRGAGGEGTEQPQSQWKGFFSIASYRPYFNVDTFHVGERIMGSLHPHEADFFEKIRYNPDLNFPAAIPTTRLISSRKVLAEGCQGLSTSGCFAVALGPFHWLEVWACLDFHNSCYLGSSAWKLCILFVFHPE